MKVVLFVAAVIAFALVGAESASARVKRHSPTLRCVDRPAEFSWSLVRPPPRPNGCTPAVYQHNNYVGQDPDPNIRFQMQRDPQTGYSSGQY